MEKNSSVLRSLRANKDSQSATGANSPAAIIGMIGSLAFVVMLFSDRPQMMIWICAIGAVIFLVKKFFWKAKKPAPTKVNFASIRGHQISRYLNWIKSIHLAHDPLVDQLAIAIDRDLKLASPKKFLGAHLIAGPKGTGKSQLAHLIGQVLFGKDNIIEFDFKQLDQETFSNLFLDMLESVARNPHQLILLENVDSIPAYMLEPFLEILKTNQWMGEEDSEPTTFSGCMFISVLAVASDVEKSWLDQSDLVDYRLIACCSEVISWGALPFNDVAKIASLQIFEYWKSHSVHLQYITPQAILYILKENKSRANLGMHPYPQIIRQKSARALEQILNTGNNKTKIDIDEQGYFKLRSAA